MSGDGRTQYYGRGPEAFRRSAEEKPAKKGLFAGNRSLTIIFIDVIIILVIYAIYTFFLAGPTSTRTIDGYRFSVSAQRIGTSAVVTVRVGASEAASAEDPIITVRFLEPPAVPGDDGGAAGRSAIHVVKDVLPEPGAAPRVFQREVAVTADTELVEVEIEALENSFTLGTTLGD